MILAGICGADIYSDIRFQQVNNTYFLYPPSTRTERGSSFFYTNLNCNSQLQHSAAQISV